MSTDVLSGVEPARVWSHFEALTRIPRPSKEEAAVREHILGWAGAQGYGSDVDGAGNLVVRVPASPDRAAAPGVVLQAHLDMVCERDPASAYDARTGPIRLIVAEDWLTADGTTLGADDGVGVAAALAFAEDPSLAHGPLELLFTVCEEQGLTGAKALDPDLISSRLLVNLDGADRGVTVGCAGSSETFVRLRFPVEPLPTGDVTLDVGISGVRGGHSGDDIASGRINAIKALGRVLSHAHAAAPFRLACLDGGVSRNAIPREAHGVVSLAPGAEPAFRAAAEAELAALREQYAGSDDGVVLHIEQSPPTSDGWSESATEVTLNALGALPAGVLAMTPGLPGATETSTSLGFTRTLDGVLTLASMTRSSNPRALENAVASIQAIAALAGAEVEVVQSYPPWQPDLDSPLLKAAGAAFLRVVGHEPEISVVHGGLECAVIGGKIPGIEMISIGPEIEGAHAPGERVRISSTHRFYEVLAALLDGLSR